MVRHLALLVTLFFPLVAMAEPDPQCLAPITNQTTNQLRASPGPSLHARGPRGPRPWVLDAVGPVG